MREILFRGKRAGNGEWVEGFYVKFAKTCYILTGNVEVHEHLNDYGLPCTSSQKHEVIPETVGQFTGLTDKNGKKIFEGDILQCDNIKGIVKYSDKQAAFTLRWKRFNFHGGDSFKECVLADFGKFYDLKLISNTHDNPELLKGE